MSDSMAFDFITQFFFPQDLLNLLNTTILGVFDFWMVLHFLSGFVLYKLLLKINGRFRNKLNILLVILILFEFIEIIFVKQDLILPEIRLNTYFDIVFGLFGYYVAETQK